MEEKAAAVREKVAHEVRGLLKKLADVAQLRSWKVYRASEPQGALDYICDLATSCGAKQVVRSDQEVFQEVPVDGALSMEGVEVRIMAQSGGLARADLRAVAAEADIGITGVDYAIAETGSVVLMPRQGLSRLVSLVPPVHMAIVRPQDVVECLEDVFTLQRLAYHRGDEGTGSYMNFITGPSRTADIEQKLVVGVHGPKEAHLVLLFPPD